MRARGFALRDAFPDVLKGLVTAEEAQDYATPEPAAAVTVTQPEPVVVRPKFDGGSDSAVQKALAAISRATTVGRLEQLRTTADERLADGTFTKDDHASVCKVIHGKLDALINAEDSGVEHFDAAEIAAEAQAK